MVGLKAQAGTLGELAAECAGMRAGEYWGKARVDAIADGRGREGSVHMSVCS